MDLKRYATAERIPIRWILYDSWFYAKANGSATGSGMMSPSHAALNWSDADPAVFPSGLRAMYRATGWPVVAHARVELGERSVHVSATAGRCQARPSEEVESVTGSRNEGCLVLPAP
eukprot:SAG25_NODE_3850_length_949_cov_1.502353_1_plen_117_part_00